jgi:hypothetical protein
LSILLTTPTATHLEHSRFPEKPTSKTTPSIEKLNPPLDREDKERRKRRKEQYSPPQPPAFVTR